MHPLFSPEPSSVRSLSFADHSEVLGDALVDTLPDSLQPLDLPLLGQALLGRSIHLRRPRMGKGGGQVFFGPEPVQTPPEINESIAPEGLEIRQLKEDDMQTRRRCLLGDPQS